MSALEWAVCIKEYAILGVFFCYLTTSAILAAIYGLSFTADIAWFHTIAWALLWLGFQQLAINYIKSRKG